MIGHLLLTSILPSLHSQQDIHISSLSIVCSPHPDPDSLLAINYSLSSLFSLPFLSSPLPALQTVSPTGICAGKRIRTKAGEGIITGAMDCRIYYTPDNSETGKSVCMCFIFVTLCVVLIVLDCSEL